MSLGKVERAFSVKGRKVEAETVEKLCWEPQACPKAINNPAKSGERRVNAGVAKSRGSATSPLSALLSPGAMGMSAGWGSPVPSPTSKGCSSGGGGGGVDEAAEYLQTETTERLPIALAGT